MRKHWLQTHVDGVGLPTKLVGDWLENNLAYAYDYYMGLKAALLRKKLKYYDFISYSVMEMPNGYVYKLEILWILKKKLRE